MNAGDVIREEPEAQRNMLPINDVPQAAQRPATTKRRPLLARVRQFSLRQLLLLVLVAAAGLGLRTALASRSIAQHAAAAKLRRAGVMIELREPWKQQTLWQRTIFGDNRYDFVDRVVIDDITLSTDEMNGLDALSGITRCWISNCPTTNAALARIGNMSSLERLHLQAAQIDAEGIAHLHNLTRLTNLEFIDTPSLTEVDLSFLTRFPDLRSLYLHGHTVDDGHLRDLSKCPAIESLDLRRTSITNDGLSYLGHLTSLRQLVIPEANISPVGLRYLAELPKLEYLNLEGIAIDDDGLRALQQIPSLETISLADTRLTDDGLAALGAFRELRDLAIGHSAISGVGLACLAEHPHLSNLDLRGSEITDEGLEQLQRIVTLRNVRLESTRVTAEGIAGLQRALPDCYVWNDFGRPKLAK
jgi:Leucine-rich repeat (LRR) protein